MAKMQKDTVQFESFSYTKSIRYSILISFPFIYELIDYFYAGTFMTSADCVIAI